MHFAYVFEEYVDFESQEIRWEAVVQDNFLLQQNGRISRTRVPSTDTNWLHTLATIIFL